MTLWLEPKSPAAGLLETGSVWGSRPKLVASESPRICQIDIGAAFLELA